MCSHDAIALFSAFVVDVVCCDSGVLVMVVEMVVAELSVDVVVVVVLPVPSEVDVLEVLDEVLYEEEVCC